MEPVQFAFMDNTVQMTTQHARLVTYPATAAMVLQLHACNVQ